MKRTMSQMVAEAREGMEQQHARGLAVLETIENTARLNCKYEADDVLAVGHKALMSETMRHPEGARWECLMYGLLEIAVNEPMNEKPMNDEVL